MALTDEEKALVAQENYNKWLLEPFTRITDQWGVETQHKFQKRIRDIYLVASDDLENDWSVKVIAGTTGVVVAEFTFKEYGRINEMRRVQYTKDVPPQEFIDWVEYKVQQNRIKYSKLAERRGLQFTDPRVIHDVAYRIIKSINKNGSKHVRRKWYNKGKESSIGTLYDQLFDAAQEVALRVAKEALKPAT